MANFTENYHLKKPEDAEYYDVADFNGNMDIIDGALGAVAAQADSAEIADKIGEPADTVLHTVFGKMNGYISPDGKGVRIIKSIQRVTYGIAPNTYGGSRSISPVDPERCITFYERLYDGHLSGVNQFNYTLTANAVNFSHSGFSSSPGLSFGLWVIEFY